MSKEKNPLLDPRNHSAATQMVHGGGRRSPFNETSEAIYLNSGYSYPSSEHAELLFQNKIPGAHNYSRFANPTVDMFQDRMALLEGAGAARAFASGMAAVTNAVMSQVRAGDHIVAAQALFGGCRYVVEDYAPRFGVSSTLVDGRDPENFARAMQPNTKVVFIETPTNPTLELVDIKAVAEITHAHGAKLIVDNVFSTALYQKPLELGADLVTYSATKHIDGQGRVLGGVVLGSREIIEADVHTFLRQTGATLSAFNAWVLLKGLETYALRVRQMTDSAQKIAEALASHPKLNRVIYPHEKSHPQYDLAKRQMQRGSTLLALDVKSGQEGAFKLSDSLAVVLISNNLGDAKSLITHPRTTTHARLTEEARLETGVTPGLLRLSVGLEDPDDLIADLMYALDQV
jgi:O-succinylhomoserine sulfhydrylase